MAGNFLASGAKDKFFIEINRQRNGSRLNTGIVPREILIFPGHVDFEVWKKGRDHGVTRHRGLSEHEQASIS